MIRTFLEGACSSLSGRLEDRLDESNGVYVVQGEKWCFLPCVWTMWIQIFHCLLGSWYTVHTHLSELLGKRFQLVSFCSNVPNPPESTETA